MNNLNPLHLMILCAKFGLGWPNGSGEEDENVKVYDDNNNDDGQRTTFDQNSSIELSTQVSKKSTHKD